MRVVVLASGRGSNLEALIEAQQGGTLPIRLVGVYSDKARARALELARDQNIAAVHIDPRKFSDRAAFDAALFASIAGAQPDLIVLAGFMRILEPSAIKPWLGRMINIHPSLLPLYPGLHTHRRVLEAGDRQHGASVHFVTAELDGGPVIARTVIDVLADDTEERLAHRLLAREHHLLCTCVGLIANGQIAWSAGTILSNGLTLTSPLQLGDEIDPRAE